MSAVKPSPSSSLSLLLPPLFPTSPPSLPNAHVSSTMSILRRLTSFPLKSRRLSSLAAAAALRQDTTLWTPAPLSLIESAAESLFHVTVDLSDCPDLASSHTRAGQYLQLRVPDVEKPSFLAIASPPSGGSFEFLVKSVAGSTAEALCGLRRGDVVELGPVMGGGFPMDRVHPPEDFPTLLIFATGSGISPIRSLIEGGFGADRRVDVRLYYGARNLKRMAYRDRFNDWEDSGVKIVPVLSQPEGSWIGETGYVQTAFAKAMQVSSPSATGAVLCGQKQMTEERNIQNVNTMVMQMFQPWNNLP